MTAAELEVLAERLMLGEYTTADLHAAARCARGWAKVDRMMQSDPGVIELFGYRGREIPWSIYPGGLCGSQRFTADTAMEAVEAAEVGK